MKRQERLTRRTLGRLLLATPLIAGTLATLPRANPARADDIEPMRTPFYQMMEVTPERPGANGDQYSATAFANLIPPGTSSSLANRASILPDGPVTSALSAEWKDYFGFSPEDIHSLVVQDDDAGFLMIIDGHFDNDDRARIIATWESNSFAPFDKTDQDFTRYIWTGLDNYPSADLPHLKGLRQGHYATLAITENGRIVVASDPDLATLVHLAERKRTEYMTFAPGVGAARGYEPPGVFEALVLPGNRFVEPGSLATPVSSDGIVSSIYGLTVMTHTDRPDWTIIAAVDRVDIDDTDSGDVYASYVEARFALATSASLGVPYPEIMSLDSVETEYSTAIFTFTPKSDNPPDILQFARQGDLEFLRV